MSNSNTENGAPIWDNRVFYSWWKKFLPLKTQSNSLDLTQNGSPGLYFSPVPLRASVHQCVCDGEWSGTNTKQQVWYLKKKLALLPLRNENMSLILPFRKKKTPVKQRNNLNFKNLNKTFKKQNVSDQKYLTKSYLHFFNSIFNLQSAPRELITFLNWIELNWITFDGRADNWHCEIFSPEYLAPKKNKEIYLKDSTVLFLFNNHDPASKDNPQI